MNSVRPWLSRLNARYRPNYFKTSQLGWIKLIFTPEERPNHPSINTFNSNIMDTQKLESVVEKCSVSENAVANHKDDCVTNGIPVPDSKEMKTIPSSTSPIPNSAILRYELGAKRFELSCMFHGKCFNFDRPANEPLSTFYGRVIANMSKKIKTFHCDIEDIHLVLGNEPFDPQADTIANVFAKSTSSSSSLTLPDLKLKIGNEKINIDINPPEVQAIKFLKHAMVGFPILPVKIEGIKCNLYLSKYHWEFSRETDDEIKKHLHHYRKKSLPADIWSPCISLPQPVQNFVFVPNDSLLDTKLRLTCTPSNDGIQFGHKLTAQMPVRISASPVKSKFLFQERLERLDTKPTVEENPNFIRIISYNALADTYATKEWFTASPEESLTIDYRLPVLNRELQEYQGDLICLQEVDDRYYENNFKPFMSTLGYAGLYSCKDKGTKEGVVIFYNSVKLNLIEDLTTVIIAKYMRTLEFYKTLEKYSNIVETLDERNTVLQIAVLESKTLPNTIIVMANTHLYFHPDADHIRLLQTMTSVHYLEQKANEVKSKFPEKKVTVMFCGDFNCTPPFSSFRLLSKGQIHETDYDWTSHATEKLNPGIEFSHGLNFINSHPDHELTNIVANFEGCLDYIFYQSNINLLKTYPPPSKKVIGETCEVDESKVSLPNFHCASDHVPLIADFNL